ncbi:hypothetical protein Tco_1386482 [Tanacetum coccineum]
MASFDHRLNPLFSIKECSSCGALYTTDFCCSKGGLEDKILCPKPPQNCATCGDPVDGLYCRSCAFSCGNGAHIGYNCPPKALIISNSEQCTQTIDKLPQTLPSVHPTCNFGDENSFTYDSKPNYVDDSLNVFNPPPQPLIRKKKANCGKINNYNSGKDRYWKILICYDDDEDYTIAITHVLLTEEPVDSLIIEDEHLDTIPATESDEVIKSSVEELVPIPSESEGISDGVCDVPLCDNPCPVKLSDHSKIVQEVNDVDQEEKEFDLENIIQIQDVILREKLLNINRLIANIESLNDNSTPYCVLKSTSPFPIPDSNSFFEKSDTFSLSLFGIILFRIRRTPHRSLKDGA